MKYLTAHKLIGFWLIALLTTAFSAPLNAQNILEDLTRSVEQDKDTVKQKEVVSLADLSNKLSQTIDLLNEIEEYLAQNGSLEEDRKQLISVFANVDSVVGSIDTTHIDIVTMTDDRARLTSYRSQLEYRLAPFSKRMDKLDDYRIRLKQHRKIWSDALDKAIKESYPKDVRNRLYSIIGRIDETDQAIIDELGKNFEIINRAFEEKRKIDQLISWFNSIESNYTRGLFNADGPPLWKLDRHYLEMTREKMMFDHELEISKTDLRIFFEQNQEIVPVFLFLFIAFVFIFFHVRKKEKIYANKFESSETSIIIRKKPLSLAFLLSISLLSVITTPPPIIVSNIILLLIYITVLNIIRDIVSSRINYKLLLLGVMLLINPIFFFKSEIFIIGRIILLLEAAIVINMMVRIKANDVLDEIFNGKALRFAKMVPNLIILLFSIAVIANVLGNITLAKLLTYGSVRTLVIGISYYAAAITLQDLTNGLLRYPNISAINIVYDHKDLVIKRIKQTVSFLFVFFWLKGALQSFDAWNYVVAHFNMLMSYEVHFGSIVFQIGDVVLFIVTILVSWLLANLIEFVLNKELFKRVDLPRGVPGAISKTVYYIIIVLGFFLGVSQAGFELSQFSIILGALSVGIGFGLQNIISNFISGIILVYERPIQEGDKIEVGNMLGSVTSIGVRSSKIKTYDGSEVIVPNSNLISNELINWTLSDQKKRIKVSVGVAYGNNPRKVADILMRVASEYEKTLKYPKPMVLFTEFGDSSLNFLVMFWTTFDDGFTAGSEVAMNIYDALEEAGIEIPFPQRVVTFADKDNNRLRVDVDDGADSLAKKTDIPAKNNHPQADKNKKEDKPENGT